MKHSTISIFSILAFSLLIKSAHAQLIVGTVATAEELAQSMVGSGVTISNITLNCSDGAWGSFNGTNSDIGLDSGIILSSGANTNAIGPNMSTGITTAYNAPGDNDLTAICGSPTFDACVLEFDLVTTGDSVKFNYVFGSDEYTEWVNSVFNDVFAFLISGPGIPVPENIALVPQTLIPVSINNVNCLNNSPYYFCNDPNPYYQQCSAAYNCPTDPATTTIEYDGFTYVLTAIHAVQPCETYHLKLAISDAGDGVLDSGVFLQAGSLTSSGTSVTVVSSYIDPNSSTPAIVEGCFDGAFNFVITNSPVDTMYIHYTIGGTATNGTDYTEIPDSLQILPGDTSASIIIHSFNDLIAEGSETVTLYLYLPCSSIPFDSATIVILDTLVAKAGPDTTICIGNSVQLSSNGADSWSWNPGSGLSCTNCQNPIATPNVTTTYTLTITVGGCNAYDVVTIVVDNPLPVSVGPDLSICLGDSVQLNALNGNTYSWTPSTGLSCNTCGNPWASPNSTTTYIVTGTNGCFTTKDTITITVSPSVDAAAFGSTTVCPGDTVQLSASGGTTYSWSPADGLSDPESQNPYAIDYTTTTYTVLVGNQFGCSDTASVTINVYDIPEVTVSPTDATTPNINDTTIYLGNSLTLTATGGGSYLWFPSTYLTDPNISNPYCNQPQDTIVYYVIVTSPEGCKTIDSVVVNVRWDALVLVPSGFSPNNDGHNDFSRLLVRGIFSLDHFYIYNRWGEIVFHTSDLTFAENTGWDGKYKGTEEPVGVYVYLVMGTDHSGNSIQREGNVTLVR
ncbi:MAG TPA: choice-of-anchor L domain-containing protein [Chitinophagales bacterium]|nr:choice-of-anchor L domain-containing protein [Chitinophagales bacterium]